MKKLLTILFLIVFATGLFFVVKKSPTSVKADTGAPVTIIATYDSTTGQLNTSGNYSWNLCFPGNNKKWVGFALFTDGAFPSSNAPDSRALDGTGMHLANGGNACETDPGPWSDSHILSSTPASVCVVIYDVEVNTEEPPNTGDRSTTGAGTDFNEDNSYHDNGDSYPEGSCTTPEVITPTATPTATPTGTPGPTPTSPTLPFQFGGPPSPPPVTGQVLGASTMAKTGTFEENLSLAIMGIGGLLTFQGFKSIKEALKRA